MSKLNVDQKTIKDLFQSKKSDFLIPDYQRPYAWGEAECRTLWDDIFSFAIPDEGKTEFDSNSEYFLGPIVTFRNEDKLEVIDGQQRLTTLMLLLRAFYSKFGHMQDKASISTKQNIEKCLWKTDEFGEPDMSQLKIDSEVATDNDKEEFLEILRTGIVNKEMKSKYACNFRFFQNNIDEFLSKYPTYFAYLPTRIMNNCILLPIEAESQDTALRIFSTLNDRGKPLSDADIFKAQFYKHFSKLGKKEEFIAQWKKLEELCERIFHPISGTPMDELFTRYMYFVRDRENPVAPGILEETHKDVYYIDGCSQEECLVLLERYGELLINDGMNRFGFGCHESQDEIMLDKYNVVTIYSQQLSNYNEFFEAHGIEKVESLITAWDTFSDETPGQAERCDYKGKSVYDLPEELKDWGMYLADTRAE